MKLRNLFEKFLSDLDGIENAENELRFIFKKALSINDTDFILMGMNEISEDMTDKIGAMVSERLTGKPIQYILGEWDFCGLTFKVDENVLIPRPETEILCNYVLDYIKDFKDTPYVGDLCSGSGCIGLTIKHKRPDAYVNLFEKSISALACINENAKALCPNQFLAVTIGDIFQIDSYGTLPEFDVLVSNPPYIKSSEIPNLQKEVQFEPKMALDGGEDGMIFYRFIIENWIRFLKKDGMFAFECGEGQADEIKELLEKNDFRTEVIKDYRDVDRFVIGKRYV